MGHHDQHLFFAEFLVDRVNVPSIRAMHTEMLPVTTCVSFQILNLPPININQESSAEDCTCNGDIMIFKKGKSCLFALPAIVLEKPLGTFPINMSVYKKLPAGVLPDVMLIGTHQIETKDLINEMLNSRVFKNENPCKTLKDTFKLTTATGQRVGEVTVFLRMSCFGKKIVTQFQIPHNKKPYLFKGGENSPIFQCKRIPSTSLDNETTAATAPRCNCEPTMRSSRGDENMQDRQEPNKSRVCCPVTIAPPCPSPARQLSSSDVAARPCCPSNRGERCPTAVTIESHGSRKDHRTSRSPAEPNIRQGPFEGGQQCCCSPKQ